MILRPSFGCSGRLSGDLSRLVVLLVCALQVLSSTSIAALPKRLILALDGIAYRDMQALQEGVTYKDARGRQFHRQAFHEGYLQVSRNVSTFPSTSDVAWTDIFGDRPLRRYHRPAIWGAQPFSVTAPCRVTSAFTSVLQQTHKPQSRASPKMWAHATS